MYQVFELIIRGKVALLTKADSTAFNYPCDDTYRDTFKAQQLAFCYLMFQQWRSVRCCEHPVLVYFGRYVVGAVVKVSSLDKSIEHQQIRGNSVSSSVNKLIEHQQTGETSVPSVDKLIEHQQIYIYRRNFRAISQ
ncbi:hypothetical protein RhiirA4_472252 [Rhizophagus irregularis]|uniref:Uncharacterized protein n=1 Tax=Rhizophagus irregularis TaxID=588596 RepID=A0A2I1H4M5_9GLOM|nr:hypothetical protein RhiirA4_472252 [Rhizophagus irregularis]